MEAPGFLKRLARYVLRAELTNDARERALLNSKVIQKMDDIRRLSQDVREYQERGRLLVGWYHYVYRDQMSSEHRAVVEYLEYGARGENPKQMGVHPFKRWDRWPLPEDVAGLVEQEEATRVAQFEARG